MDKPFIHLHAHSAYSLSEGAIHPKDLVKLAKKNMMPAVAVTDTGNLFGAMEFARYAVEEGIQPIIGCEILIEFEKPQKNQTQILDSIVLLAQNNQGYKNLLALVSQSFLETDAGNTPHITSEALLQNSTGLIMLSGGPRGPLNRFLAQHRKGEAEKLADQLKNVFGDRFYIELQRHFLADPDNIETQIIDLAYAKNIPLVATNNVYFASPKMHFAHEVLLSIAAAKKISEPDRPRSTPHHCFKASVDMYELFKDVPEAVENTYNIAKRCAFMPEVSKPLLPAFAVEGRTEAEELALQAREGLENRLSTHVYTEMMSDAEKQQAGKAYKDRLEFELSVVSKIGFAGYFLIVSDFIKWAKQNNIPVGPGRGSGAGSVVSWSLMITDLDPLRFGLLFERFLNPERVSMPDFDIDFCQDRRDEVIRYVQQKYGNDRVAQIITFGKLQARAVLRDVGRVLEMPYGQIDRIAKLIPFNPAAPTTLADALESDPALQAMRKEEDVSRLMETALQLEGLYRHASTHAAGVVIGDRSLQELIPLYRDPKSDMPVTQFNMKDVENAGLVKFDFLGLKTLTVLVKACEMLKAKGIEIDLNTIPLDDAKTYTMLGRGDSVGIFQLESSGMRDVLVKLKPDRFEDIIAVVALYRPGPMDNIPKYINCKHKREEPDYLYPTLEPILKETYGIMIYQEQVMQCAQVLSGYSLGSADLLRRAMGKKIKEEMDAQRKVFVDGAVAKSVSQSKASEIFDQINKFAGYGFNKSHAAAYALIAYQTAYLKANYTKEFMAASMSLDQGNTDKLNIFRQELQRLKIPLYGPDVNKSFQEFSVENDGIRYSLAALKGVGVGAVEALVDSRNKDGAFKDIIDFATRLDQKVVNKRMLESMTKAGAFDSIEPNRAKIFANVETLSKLSHSVMADKASQQNSLFGGEASGETKVTLAHQENWSILEKLQHEFDAVGFYLSSHPLDTFASILPQMGIKMAAEVLDADRLPPGRQKLAGVVVSKKERRSAKGNKYAFLGLSDPTAVYEVTVFSDTLVRARDYLEEGKLVVVSVDVISEEDGVRITAQDIRPLETNSFKFSEVKLTVDDNENFTALQKTLSSVPKGSGRVTIRVPHKDQYVLVELADKYQLTPLTLPTLKDCPQVSRVDSIL